MAKNKFGAAVISSDHYTDLLMVDSPVDGKAYVHEFEFDEFSAFTPDRSRAVVSFDDQTWDVLAKQPAGSTITYSLGDKERNYKIRRRDFKRKKAWLEEL